ncbi:hypothetical protein MVES1_001201 [Malassezia vespertilionis]|uniref:Pre-rRNA-processing protein RIX1 n=1 Tax=Malassezia vespertilionis TaxID=2020962 RepID=A0A2N1JEU6_9BASI|nr:uncharacterized protein MVES1_001201 [Malassezia vespertilionis]PKI85074.1 hypothetical protein MVES_001132 [Malassezia vespertilionis]WFD05867.1 hypothetical protein MVES1_001201 [Malassezia vespertilionis]
MAADEVLGALLGADNPEHAHKMACSVQRDTIDAYAQIALKKRIDACLCTAPARQAVEPLWAVAAVLIDLYLDTCGWSAAEAHGTSWIQQMLVHTEQTSASFDASVFASLAPLLRCVLVRVMGRESAAHPEYFRVVAAPHISRTAAALAQLFAAAVQRSVPWSALCALLHGTTCQVCLYATTYRAVASSLHATCNVLLFGRYASIESAAHAAPLPDSVCKDATVLLASLARTGAATKATGNSVSQVQLWSATATQLLDAAVLAVQGCAPSLAWPMTARHGALGWEACTSDYAVCIPACEARVACLLGDETHRGVLAHFFATPTPHPVPVPLGAVLALVHAMLQARYKDSDAPIDQLRLERHALVVLHRTALVLLPPIVELGGAHAWRFLLGGMPVLDDVVRLAEAAHGKTRSMAIRTLALLFTPGQLGASHMPGLAVPLDPNSPIVQRMARLAIQDMSALLLPDLPASTHVFESDAVALAARPVQDAVLAKSSTAWSAAQGAVQLFSALFPRVACSAAPGSRELLHTGTMALLGLSEALLHARVLCAEHTAALDLCIACVAAIATTVVSNAGALVTFVLSRARIMFQLGAHSSIAVVRAACDDALVRMLPLFRARAPPVYDSVDCAALEVCDTDTVVLPKIGAKPLPIVEAMDQAPCVTEQDMLMPWTADGTARPITAPQTAVPFSAPSPCSIPANLPTSPHESPVVDSAWVGVQASDSEEEMPQLDLGADT